MRTQKALIGLALVSCSSLASAAPRLDEAPVAGFRLLAGDGVFERSHAGGAVPARSGASFSPRADIACPRGCTLEVPGIGVLRLDPGASARDRGVIVAHPGALAPLEPVAWIKLDGAATAELSPKTERSLLLEASDGTQALVRAGGAVRIQGGALGAKTSLKTARIGSFAGDALVHGQGGDWAKLHGGFGVEARGTRLDAPHPLPTAPVWMAADAGPGRVGLTSDGGAVRVGAAWQPDPIAASYKVEIASDPNFQSVVLALETKQPSLAETLPVGHYFVRVAGLDASAMMGPPSAIAQMRVASMGLPAGSLTDASSRTFVVPASCALQFGEGDGFEVALGRKRFSPAHESSLSIVDQPAQTLWLRLAGDPTSTTSYIVERRTLRADIDVSPHNARWPADALLVTVHLVDPSGRIAPSTVEPKLAAFVGVSRVDLRWTRKGATFTAQLPPRTIVENTIVRVMASDEHDNTLGRGFVEVAPSQERAAPLATR